MDFWTEVHWHEGMFLRPHHMQAGTRWNETMMRAGFAAVRPFGWGFVALNIADEPLEKATMRVDQCTLRLKDGTWVRVPENTAVGPLNFDKALEANNGQVDIYFGIPEMQQVRANAISLENPESNSGEPRYEPEPVARRDENTGANTQTIYMRRMRGRLFSEGEDMTGFEVVRLGRVRRTSKPGATPGMDELGCGPLLAMSADAALSKLVSSLSDEIEAKDEELGKSAREHHMTFTDGVAANTEHLLKIHVLNEARGHLIALLQSPVLHPYDVYTLLCRLVGHLSIFHSDMVPGPADFAAYDHDHPAECLNRLKKRIQVLLQAMLPHMYEERVFTRTPDERGREGLAVELERRWIDDNLEMFIGLHADEMATEDVYRNVYGTDFDMKLSSPRRSSRITTMNTRGLKLEIKPVPPGKLPQRQGLHYFKVNKTGGTATAERIDYWRECEAERGIFMTLKDGRLEAMEKFRPTLYIVLKD